MENWRRVGRRKEKGEVPVYVSLVNLDRFAEKDGGFGRTKFLRVVGGLTAVASLERGRYSRFHCGVLLEGVAR